MEQKMKNGWEILDNYSKWMYHTYKTFVRGTVFDIGAGLGRMIPFYIDQSDSITTTEINKAEVAFINQQFTDSKVKCIYMDITSDDYKDYISFCDTIMCINCLEHIEDHSVALKNMKSMLKQDGHLIVFVPAMQKLYNQFDVNVGHYRRYEPGELQKMGEELGLKIIKNIHFNKAGMMLYQLKGKKAAKNSFNMGDGIGRSMDSKSGKLINIASIILEPIEAMFPPRIGLSELIVYKKNN